MALQERLINLLQAEPVTAVSSVGEPTTPQRYLVDLRILSCLIAASWPVAKAFFVDQAPAARLVDTHVAETRQRIDTAEQTGRAVRKLTFYDTPPLNPHTCAALLATADRLLTTDSPSRLRDNLRPLLAHAPAGMQQWARQFLNGEGSCSSGLQAALGVEIGNRHVIKPLGITVAPPVSPPPQPIRFSVNHIPAHLLPEWHAEHLASFTRDIKPHLLRRAAAARLAQLAVGGHAAVGGQHLGIPRHASLNALNVVRRQLSHRRHRKFDAAVDAIAEQLNDSNELVDYGARRDALAGWCLTPQEWDQLTGDLRRETERRASRWPGTPWIDWHDSKRVLASMWIWVHLTGGDIFAPAIRPHPELPRPGGRGLAQIHSRWRQISAENPTGHYAVLRTRLVPYAEQLLRAIHNGSFDTSSIPQNKMAP